MTALPVGFYEGTVHGPLIVCLMGKAWAGKTFTGDRVTNRIGGRDLIEGQVTREGEVVVITYPQLGGLRDELTDLFGDGSRWAGTMQLGRWTARFTLTRPKR